MRARYNDVDSYDLPHIHENGTCHWIYKTIDEQKRKRKKHNSNQHGAKKAKLSAETTSLAETTMSETATSELRDVAPEPKIVDEMIDRDDVYKVKNGNLVKDGIVVASGEIFEGGKASEDEMIENFSG